MSEENIELVAGEMEAKSSQLIESWTEQAEVAIKAGDQKALRNVLAEASKHNIQLAKGFDAIVCLYAGKTEPSSMLKQERQESDSVVAAMRDVALAAIELSKLVASDR